ncbi:unnamed protein product [Thlaspi arvense]|uniref:Reticulon-like protein n=1 Tax=Thlaspi arvense TaxID=13288 RepID=A0AAU9TBN6_THLAR|nr:unnamed protein product [Thlaspi arvense]
MCSFSFWFSHTVADVMLWRRKNLTLGILVVTLAAWVMFEKSGYTLLSFVSSVLLLLLTILFLWAKSAAILNRQQLISCLFCIYTRPAPPLPDVYLSEEVVNDIAALIRDHTNKFLSTSKDIALGKDTRMFFKIAACLWLISVAGGLTDFLTLGYTSLFIVLTVPALYEKYEDSIDRFILIGCMKLRQLYVKFNVQYIGRIQSWVLQKKKLS